MVALTRPASLDVGLSLASLSPVFVDRSGLHDFGSSVDTPAAGQQWRRVILLPETSTKPREAVLRHEAVHVAQEVRDEILFATDIGDGLLARGGAIGKRLSNVMSLDVIRPLDLLDTGVRLTMKFQHGTS
jgi:hypothetical protein